MRPVYQTQGDLEREQRIGAFFGTRYRLRLVKRGELDHFDFDVLLEDRPLWIAEIKRRFYRVTAFRTLFISDRKIRAGIEEAETRGLKPLIIIGWNDAAGWIDARRIAHHAKAGRRDRGDPADVELCAHYLISDFRYFWHR